MVSGPGLKDEANGGQKSLWNVPINRIQKSHMTPRSMILWGNWLFAVWYCGEIDSAQYDTVERLTQCSMILWGDWLSSVSYPGEMWITRQKLNKIFFYTIDQWPRLVPMIKKSGGRKSRWTVPLMRCRCRRNTLQCTYCLDSVTQWYCFTVPVSLLHSQ